MTFGFVVAMVGRRVVVEYRRGRIETQDFAMSTASAESPLGKFDTAFEQEIADHGFVIVARDR